MQTIKMLYHIDATKEKVFAALTTIEGIQNWWSKHTSGEGKADGRFVIGFGPGREMTFQVKEASSPNKVTWVCEKGSPDWIGNPITFAMDDNEGKTRLRFSHEGFKEANDSYASTTFGWSKFLVSLRQYIETGTGAAFNPDVAGK